MASKFYAVRKGKKIGIFRTWADCKSQVSGFSGAEYKSFKTQQEAQAYLEGGQDTADGVFEDENSAVVKAYVDGSYNKNTREFSHGMIILQDGKEFKFAQKYDDKDLAAMHNVAGEIKGAQAAMQYAVDHCLDGIIIYHDYEGIAKWCLGAWQANKEGTKAYKAFYDSIKDKVAIKFVKVTGHSNDKYNDIADELAKQALGLGNVEHVLEEEK